MWETQLGRYFSWSPGSRGFFVELLEQEEIEFPRSLLPQNQDDIGKPDPINRFSSTRKFIWILAYVLKWESPVLERGYTASENILWVEFLSKARNLWIKFPQCGFESDIQLSVKSNKHRKVHGPFAGLSPRHMVFAFENLLPLHHKSPAILPGKSRLTYLLMSVLVQLSEAQDIERSIIEIALPTISFRR